jgi:hypothetical protein
VGLQQSPSGPPGSQSHGTITLPSGFVTYNVMRYILDPQQFQSLPSELSDSVVVNWAVAQT